MRNRPFGRPESTDSVSGLIASEQFLEAIQGAQADVEDVLENAERELRVGVAHEVRRTPWVHGELTNDS